MEYDRRKFLKIGGTAAVGLAIATAFETSNENSASAQVGTPTPTTPCTDLNTSPVVTPTPGPTCSSTCALPTPMPTPISSVCPTPAANQDANPYDAHNLCLINQTASFVQLEMVKIVGLIDNQGCAKKDHNRARVTAIQDLLSDSADKGSAADELDISARLLRKIKIPDQPSNYPPPPKKDSESVNCWLDYISGLLGDLFARLQGECYDRTLGDQLPTGSAPTATVSIPSSLNYIQTAVRLVTEHLAHHHFCKDCKNFGIRQASKA